MLIDEQLTISFKKVNSNKIERSQPQLNSSSIYQIWTTRNHLTLKA